jgi:hypothetical protein
MRSILALILALLLSATLAGADKKKDKPSRPPELTVLKLHAARNDNRRVDLDVTVQNTSPKALRKLRITFEFRDTEDKIIAARNMEADDPDFPAGEEMTLALETPDQVRAVAITVSALDRDGRELYIGNPGPYPIE